ncbi:MAG: tRNA (adenosine(37)-N6)-threonylcarbamoyltransferase complex ATPase subunit type 1 TsaE [Fimbriimonadales bacterium]
MRPSEPCEWLSHSPEATEAIAREVASWLMPDTLILLIGALGAGKTTFVRGLARALGITEPVRSPTFTLVNEYHIQQPESLRGLPLFHLDLYRTESTTELATLGLDEILEQGGITLIEWAERLERASCLSQPSHLWQITLTVLPDESRKIQFQPLEGKTR